MTGSLDAAEIERRLHRLAPRRLQRNQQGEAAVLITLIERRQELHLLLTLRSQAVATHKGQISFPGGFREGREPLVATALRETQEEVGIAPENVRILGAFHDYTAVTRARVRPFVGLLQGRWKAVPNPDEVAAVLEPPLELFARQRPRIEVRRRMGRLLPLYFWEYEGETVWGLTAAMIKDFLDLLQIRTWKSGV